MTQQSVESVLSVSISPTKLSKLSIICALVPSRIDYCNSFVAGCAKNLICKLQKVENNVAHLISLSARTDHVSRILRALHWLPVDSRIQYKIIILYFKSLNSQAPSHLSDLVQLHVPSRELRSSADTRLLRLPSAHLKFSGLRAFFYQAPMLWNNNLPYFLRHYSSAVSFKSALKASSGL